jgi:hypothetical protein
MRRLRGDKRTELVEQLKGEVPYVRHAWELGRLKRRLLADLKMIAESCEHRRMVPMRVTDPYVSVASRTDKKLARMLRESGSFDDEGLIYGGRTVVAHRPLTTDSIVALKRALFELERLFVQAQFSSPLERDAFCHSPKTHDDDRGVSKDEDWQHAWVRMITWRHSKAVACEALDLKERTYDERRRRRRAKAGGLSLNDQELLEQLEAQIASEKSGIQNHDEFRTYCDQVAEMRGLRIPLAVRRPKFTRSTRAVLPKDCRYLVDDHTRWKARASRQPKISRALWKELIELREKRIAGTLAAFALSDWMTRHTK